MVNVEQMEAELEQNDRDINEICGRIGDLCARLDILGKRIQTRMEHGETGHGKRIEDDSDRGEIQDIE